MSDHFDLSGEEISNATLGSHEWLTGETRQSDTTYIQGAVGCSLYTKSEFSSKCSCGPGPYCTELHALGEVVMPSMAQIFSSAWNP